MPPLSRSIVVAATLALAGALLVTALSCSSDPDPTVTPTSTTEPDTPTPTQVYIPPTLTPTNTPFPNPARTPAPTSTPPPTATATPIAPANVTPTAAPSPTPTPVVDGQSTQETEQAGGPGQPPPTSTDVIVSEATLEEIYRAPLVDESYQFQLLLHMTAVHIPESDLPRSLTLSCRSGSDEPRPCGEIEIVNQEQEQTELTLSLPPGLTEVSVEEQGTPLHRLLLEVRPNEPDERSAHVSVADDTELYDVLVESQVELENFNGIVARVTGYWSDGTANVELFAAAELLHPDSTVTCHHEGTTRQAQCDGVPVQQPGGRYSKLLARLPIGFTGLEISSEGEQVAQAGITVSERIIGVNPEVLDCFVDTKYLDANAKPDLAIGCGGWYDPEVIKWPQETPVRIKLVGPTEWTNFFTEVMTELRPLLGLDFEWVSDGRESFDVEAIVGITHKQALVQGIACDPEPVVLGCANAGMQPGTDEQYITIYSPDLEADSPQPLPEAGATREQLRATILHEAVHAFSGMGHRLEVGTAMHSRVNEFLGSRPTLNPMDQALIRLLQHPAVFTRMSFAELERVTVHSDQLMDPPDSPTEPAPGWGAWKSAMRTFRAIRESGSARYRVSTELLGCEQRISGATLELGHLSPKRPNFLWSHLDSEDVGMFVVNNARQDYEQWIKRDSEWSLDIEEGALPGWMPELSDPYQLLVKLLIDADWATVTLADNGDSTTLSASLGPPLHFDGLSFQITVNNATAAITGYEATWDIDIQPCTGYKVVATDGTYGEQFVFPPAIRVGSQALENCETVTLPNDPRSVRVSASWHRECATADRGRQLSRSYRFTTSDWSLLRFDIQATDDAFAVLTPDSGQPLTVNPSTSLRYPEGLEGYGHIVSTEITWSFGWPTEGSHIWYHNWLPPGEHRLDVVSREPVFTDAFTLVLNAQPIPSAPGDLRFKAVATSPTGTCALLTDGTPLCWGRPRDTSAQPTIPTGKFEQIYGGYHYCALSADGMPQCWDFKEAGTHDCDAAEVVASGQLCSTSGQPEVTTDGTRDQASVFISGFYYDQTPPSGEAFTELAPGNGHTCALRQDGSVACWGRNDVGESAPPADAKFATIQSSHQYSCGITSDQSVKCWGDITDPELEETVHGSMMANQAPTEISLTEIGIAFAQGSGVRVCGLSDENTVVCFGAEMVCSPEVHWFVACSDHRYDDWESAGDGITAPVSIFPPDSTKFAKLSTEGPDCGIKDDGTAVCWHQWPTVGSPPATEHFTQISSGERHACGLRTDGTIACWGENGYGQSTPPNGEYLGKAQP